MSDLNNVVIQSIETVANAIVSNLKFDRSITAEIVKIKNAEIGEYVVKFEGNEILAYATNVTDTYQIGDSVYVRVPESNFSNKKLIERKLNKNNGVGQLKTTMIEIENASPNLIVQKEEAALIAGTWVSQNANEIIYEKNNSRIGVNVAFDAQVIDNKSFKDYANIYDTMQVSAIFTTAFWNNHHKGNYGICIEFETTDQTEAFLYLDFNNFVGDPYHCEKGVYQSAQFKINTGYHTGIRAIYFFQEGFEQDTIDEENLNVANLFVKDISVQFVNVIDYSKIDYYMDIKTPDGTVISNEKVRLQANLKYRGLDILNADDCQCYWFKQNFEISPKHEQYNINAGSGWELIYPKNEEEKNIFKPEIELFAEGDDPLFTIGFDQEFKLVIIYKEENYFSDTILIEDKNTEEEKNQFYTLKSEVDSSEEVNKIYLYIDSNNTQAVFGDWYYLGSNGNYEQIKKQQKKIDITSLLVNTLNTFYCAVYENNEFKCNRTIQIKSSEEAADFVVQFEGKDIYSYDSKGNTDYENTEIERVVIPHIEIANAANKFSLSWYYGDEEIPTNASAAISPDNSMMQNIYQKNNNVYFKIKSKFYTSRNNNTLVLKLKLLGSDDKIYEYPKEIMFTKDGYQDSNGSTYNLVVRAKKDGIIIPMNQFIGVKASEGEELQLEALLFKDGEKYNIDDSTKVHWALNYGDGLINKNGVFTFKSTKYNVVKAEYKINNIYLSYLFPLNSYIGNDKYEFNFEIPQLIRYDASGYNPDYSQNTLIYPDGYTIELNENDFASLSNNTLNLTTNAFNGDTTNKTMPYYIIGNGQNEYYLPIILYLNTEGHENIEGWDGQNVPLDKSSTPTTTNVVYEPQVGAGYYDNDNKFNGIIMGKDSSQSHLGLYGYQSGIAYFGLRENGTAFFGSSENTGGQIVFDGKTGTISGGGGGKNAAGMTIQLGAERDENGKPIDLDITDAIKIGGGKFYVKYDGQLYANYGTIGGWNLGYTEFYNGNSVGYYDNSEEKDFSNSKTILSPHGIFTNQLYICSPDTNKIRKTDGTIEITNKESKGVYYGSFGYVAAARGEGIGITTEKKENPIILETDQSNLRLTAGTIDDSIQSIILESENKNVANGKYSLYLGSHVDPNNSKVYYNLYCDVPADKQYGIYARFA